MITKLKQSKKPIISIIIPTLNEELFLPKLLDSILKQDFEEYEVIVADANSKDKTKQIALDYGAKVVKGGMPSVGRNRGADEAKGEYLFFLDADVILPKQFLAKALNEMRVRELDLATCESKPLSTTPLDPVFHKVYFYAVKISIPTNKPKIIGYAFLIKKYLFFELNGFDEKILLGEDYELAQRASKLGRVGLLQRTNLNVSVRRLDKEGRLNYFIKMRYLNLYVRLFGPLRKKIINYEFGKFEKSGE